MRIVVSLLGLATSVLALGALWVGWTGTFLLRNDDIRDTLAVAELIIALTIIVTGLLGAVTVWFRPRVVALAFLLAAAAGVAGAVVGWVTVQVSPDRAASMGLMKILLLCGGASIVPALLAAFLSTRVLDTRKS